MMLRLSFRYFRPRVVHEVTQARIFSSRIPTPVGTNLSKLPPFIYISAQNTEIQNKRAEATKRDRGAYIFHADENTRFREKAAIKIDDEIGLCFMQNLQFGDDGHEL